MPNHLEPVRSDPPGPYDPDNEDPFDLGSDEIEPPVRPAWWRWVAILVILAMVLAGPFAFALHKLLD